ncbi:MAG: transglutaminaseTgpA domain-containing protein [Chloroflexota bacterium]
MLKRNRLEEGWTTLFLTWAMVFVAATAIVQSNLISGLHVIPFVGTIAILVGLALAKSRFPANTAHLFSLIYGLFLVLFFVGTNLPADMTWRERVFDMLLRQVEWLRDAFGGGTNRDGLIFVIQTAFVFWLLGYTASWYTFRNPREWRVVVPTGLVLLSVVYYYVGPTPLSLYLAAYMLLSLLYVARTYLIAREKSWRSGGVRYERTIWFTFLRAAFLAAMIALIAAWMMPTFTASAAVGDVFGQASGPWKEFQDNWTRLFSSLRSYTVATSDPYRDTLILGGPRSVGNTPIMDVYVPQRLPYVYWQAIVYDTYDDGGWEIAQQGDSVLHYPEDGVLNTPFTQAREVITQTVVNYLPNSSFIYAAPEVIASDRQMFVDASADERGDLLVTSLRSRYVLRLNDRYEVISRVSTADANSLRTASTSYPAWVSERYLQVPGSVTPETLELAAELAAPYDNPFDKAIAVRDYLRQTITYNDQIPAPPEGVDPVHYTLFVSKEAYCNYYASAMALMLRSQGVPTRVVSGYAQGEYDEETMSYRVRASNAHTWVEVYFPAYGWIQFEPTASIPTVNRPEDAAGGNPGDAFNDVFANRPAFDRDELLGEDIDNAEIPDGNLPDLDALAEEAEAGPTGFLAQVSIWQVIGVVLVLALAAGLIVTANEMNKRVEGDVLRSYIRLGSWARWLGILFQPAHTPYERADMMVTAVPEGSRSIRNLTQHFVLRQFSGNGDVPFDTLQEWRELRPLLIRKALTARWQRWRERQPKMKRRRR